MQERFDNAKSNKALQHDIVSPTIGQNRAGQTAKVRGNDGLRSTQRSPWLTPKNPPFLLVEELGQNQEKVPVLRLRLAVT
eukprot:1544179-Pleurochrysis_carterae.AAC.1